ncbi:TetR/AcrR family transcriptional regulator [Nocardia amamiensis]|uniref:TetR/AcrR family transcriptional regulator n=1 Tax=Nocardia amamiensis TaxID=404578 RepID=A0ABS0D2N7_9NOCA|nr:TetR/AcrR family transcriptional regulator [Nocardia amamiensis]MBF6302660.1 TetR/AcrR family transcriptional regulator [Nocardia amamiensis]
MPTTPRARARAQTMTDIVRIGREHLATDGAAALSLRAVARDLGVVSSAVYRYVRSRDELLTLLVVDGYNALGDAVDAALADAADDPIDRLRVLGRTVRRWALAEPARYGLLFGTPVPGYEAPAAETVAPGTRVIATMQTLFARAYATGKLASPSREPRVSAPLAGSFARIRDEFQLELPDWLVVRGVTFWVGLFGAVSADVFDMYGLDTFADRDELFEHQLDALLDMLGHRG